MNRRQTRCQLVDHELLSSSDEAIIRLKLVQEKASRRRLRGVRVCMFKEEGLIFRKYIVEDYILKVKIKERNKSFLDIIICRKSVTWVVKTLERESKWEGSKRSFWRFTSKSKSIFLDRL